MAPNVQQFQLQQPGLGLRDLLPPGFNVLGGLLQGFGGGTERRAVESQTRINEAEERRRADLVRRILGGEFGQIGSPGLSQGQQGQQLNRFQQSMQPQFDAAAANTFANTGLNSPLSQKIGLGQRSAAISGRAGQLQDFSTQLGFRRDQGLLSALRGL